jgi:hypothetical protein
VAAPGRRYTCSVTLPDTWTRLRREARANRAGGLYQPLSFLSLLFLEGFLLRIIIHRAWGILYAVGMDSPWSQTYWNAFIPSTSIDIAPNYQPVPLQTQWPPQPQSQLHAIFPLDSNQSEARKYTAKDWEELRLEITRLYENNPLTKVMELMTVQHGLSAT